MSTTALEMYLAVEAAVGSSVAGKVDALMEAAHAEMVADAVATCPSWCVADHSEVIRELLPEATYDHRSEWIEVPLRDGGVNLVCVRQEFATGEGSTGEPRVTLVDSPARELNAADARSLSVALAEAAALIEAITGRSEV